VVLVIDEVHTLVGSGAVGRRSGSGGGGGLDISNLLKVPLARGELQCIGATTVKEHRLYIEKDPALERRFQPVIVEEPNEDDAVEILFGLRSRYESHHGCQYTDDALEAAVKISSRYIPDRFLPDKALDLIDEAGSKARIDRYFEIKESDQNAGATLDAVSMEQMDQWRQLKEVRTMKELRISEENFEEASLLRAREMEVTKALVANGVASGSISHENLVVGVSEIEHIASCWSGVPVQKITQHESGVLTNMAGTLSKDVVGQAEAVGAVTRAMRRARCGLNSADRPIASLLFAGPTGVGKTELVKALAERFFGSQDNMTRLDMSEYMERHSVSKLIGAPPGYAGFGQGGTLTEAVRRKPFGVLLLDEIEKAHPDVWNVLLQMMEDGRLTDSNGRVVSFKNTLIVLTSNVGSKAIAKGGNTLGFLVHVDENSEDSAAYGRMRLKVLDELKTVFRPEMLNRLDEIVCFKQLEQAHVIEIARLMLRETADRMRVKGMEMALTKSAMAKLLEVGFDKEYGARPLRRAITSIVDDNLSEALLRGTINEGDVALVDYDPGYGSLTSTNSPKEATKGSGAPNAYHGVRVVGISGDEYSARNLDAAWCSFGNDFEEEEENVEELTYQQGRVVGNVVARGPVTNDVVA
jgi:ATP-dependent Clp protease ATP-binding subunit ClpC